MFKLVVLSALLAVAFAKPSHYGYAPLAYSTVPAVHYESGPVESSYSSSIYDVDATSHQSVYKSDPGHSVYSVQPQVHYEPALTYAAAPHVSYAAPALTYSAPSVSYAKIGATVEHVPTAVSHQSSSVVHSKAAIVTPIVAPVQHYTYSAPQYAYAAAPAHYQSW